MQTRFIIQKAGLIYRRQLLRGELMVPGYSFVAYRKSRIDIDSGIKPENVPDQFPKTNFHTFINGNIFSYLFSEQPFLFLYFLFISPFFVMNELQYSFFLLYILKIGRV